MFGSYYKNVINTQVIFKQHMSPDSHQTVIRQSPDSHQTVIIESSGSHQTVIEQSLDSHWTSWKTVTGQSSDSNLAVIRQSSQLLVGHHTLILKSFDSIRESLNSYQILIKQSSQTVISFKTKRAKNQEVDVGHRLVLHTQLFLRGTNFHSRGFTKTLVKVLLIGEFK